MRRRHRNHHCKHVVDKRVERLVAEHTPRQVRDRLEAVVDEELRRHGDEAEEVDGICQRRDQPRVPALLRVGVQGVERPAGHKRREPNRERARRKLIEPFRRHLHSQRLVTAACRAARAAVGGGGAPRGLDPSRDLEDAHHLEELEDERDGVAAKRRGRGDTCKGYTRGAACGEEPARGLCNATVAERPLNPARLPSVPRPRRARAPAKDDCVDTVGVEQVEVYDERRAGVEDHRARREASHVLAPLPEAHLPPRAISRTQGVAAREGMGRHARRRSLRTRAQQRLRWGDRQRRRACWRTSFLNARTSKMTWSRPMTCISTKR
eukprot:2585118-Prymnesium_polylepis.1